MSDLTAALSEARRAEAEQCFGLRKTWVDPAPGIEMVQLHYACTGPGQEPDWEAADSRVLTPNEASPGVRTYEVIGAGDGAAAWQGDRS